MVVQWGYHAFTSFAAWLLTLMPTIDPPSFLSELPADVAKFGNYVASTSAWLPWGAISVAVPILIAAAGGALLVKVVRIIYSAVTGGGTAT